MEEKKIENAEEVLSSVSEKSLLPGKIDIETEKRANESLIDPEANIGQIKAPKLNHRGSNFTPGRSKNFLKARKKRQRQQKQSRKNNRKK